MSASPHYDSPAASSSSSSSCSEDDEEQSTDLLALTPNNNNNPDLSQQHDDDYDSANPPPLRYINNNNNDNVNNQKRTQIIMPSSTTRCVGKKKRPLQLILDEKIRQSKMERRSRMEAAAAVATALASPPSTAFKRRTMQPQQGSSDGSSTADAAPTMKKMNDFAMAGNPLLETTTFTTSTAKSLTISKTIIVGHTYGGGGISSSCIGGVAQNSNEMEAGEEAEEEFSPLTCPPSQPIWGERRSCFDREENDEMMLGGHTTVELETREKDWKEGQVMVWNDDVKDAQQHYNSNTMKINKPTSLEMDNGYLGYNNNDDEEPRMDKEAKEEIGPKETLPSPGKRSRLVCEYEKAVLLMDDRLEQLEDDDDEGGNKVQEGSWEPKKFGPTWKARNEEVHAFGARLPPPTVSANVAAAVANARIIRKGRGEATALALAAEYEEPSTRLDNDNNFNVNNVGGEEDEPDKKQRGVKRKVGPTALALAEYDETGEIDSYFDNSRTAEERKQRMIALATCMEEVKIKAGRNNGKEFEAIVPGESSCASEEKQSEPLLSPTIPEAATVVNNAPTATKSSINEMICAIRHEFDEMGKALICPICQSTLKNAIILPCVHAFCKACLKDYYNPPSVKPAVGGTKKKRRKDVSPPRKPKAECPVCKTANPGKRSGEAAPHLDELARAYKLMGRSFSFAPVKYTENVLMTQLDPDEDAAVGRCHDELEDTESKVQHLQVAKAVHNAFVEQTEIPISQHSSSRPISFKEKMKVRRYQQMAKEQEAVVRADEQVLSRVARGVRGMKNMVNTVKTAFVGKVEACRTSKVNLVADVKGVSSLTQVVNSAVVVDAAAAESSIAMKQKHIRNERIGENSNSKGIETSKDEESTSEEDEFFSSREEFREESQSRYSTAVEDIQSSSCLSPAVIKDGNNVENYHQPEPFCVPINSSPRGSNVCNLERSSEFLAGTRSSIGTKGTARGSPLVFHDGNTVRKPRNDLKSHHGLSFLATHFDDTSKSKSPENVSPLASAAVEVKTSDAHISEEGAHVTENIIVGSIVFVQARTWPGINKPGGVARVTKVNPSSVNGNSTKFDVAYVLGGKEKGVDESFVSFHVNGSTTTEECPDDLLSTQGCKSHEKKKKFRQRRAIVKSELNALHPNASPFSIYCDEELKQIPPDVLKWAGIMPKKGKVKQQQTTGSAPIRLAIKCAKRVLMQSNSVSKVPPMKKQKFSTEAKDDVKSLAKDVRSNAVKSFREVIRSLSIEEVVTRADSRYSALLSSFEKQSTSDLQMTLHAVTSSLSDEDLELLESFRRFLKGKSGKHSPANSKSVHSPKPV